MPLNRSLLVDSTLILALIVVGVVGYKLSLLLLPVADVAVQPDPGCDLQQGPCGAVLPGGRLSLSLTPQPIPLAAPLEASVLLAGIEAESVTVDFAGVEMNMGLNRYVLTASGAGRYSASVTLPVCVSGRMLWQATVLVEAGRQRIAVPFRFSAGT